MYEKENSQIVTFKEPVNVCLFNYQNCCRIIFDQTKSILSTKKGHNYLPDLPKCNSVLRCGNLLIRHEVTFRKNDDDDIRYSFTPLDSLNYHRVNMAIFIMLHDFDLI